MNVNEFKEKFDLIAFAKTHYAYDDRGDKTFIRCPFHNESTPSCVISQAGWHCFGGCGEGGDSVDFLMRISGKSFREVLESEEFDSFCGASQCPIPVKEKTKRYISPAVFKNYVLQLSRRPQKMQYLINRGFDAKSIELSKIGYGVPLDVFGKRFHNPRYVIPHFSNGKIVAAKYRIDPAYERYEQDKYISHPGVPCTIYNIDVMQDNENIVYVGSQFDAAVLWYRYGIPAICPPSENIFKDEWIPLFIDKKILIWLDNDETGVNSSLKVYGKIRTVTKTADIFKWDDSFENKADFTDFLLRNGIASVKNIYDNYSKSN